MAFILIAKIKIVSRHKLHRWKLQKICCKSKSIDIDTYFK